MEGRREEVASSRTRPHTLTWVDICDNIGITNARGSLRVSLLVALKALMMMAAVGHRGEGDVLATGMRHKPSFYAVPVVLDLDSDEASLIHWECRPPVIEFSPNELVYIVSR
jgi:hypothetical protein